MIRRKRKAVVERTSAGYVVRLDRDEIDLIVRLLQELRELMQSDDPEVAPLVRRLFPPAYHLQDDAEAEAEYQRFMREDLVASKVEAIDRVEDALMSGTPMNDETVQGFMQGLNGVRLVLGTLLDVSEETEPGSVRDGDPLAGEHHLYGFLSWLLESTVLAVSR
jgi:Domain of unknown function (DUF2017)